MIDASDLEELVAVLEAGLLKGYHTCCFSINHVHSAF